MPTCGSPWLFAAYRVLRRQSVPWHPPCALVRLILPVLVVLIFLRLLRNENNLKFVVSFLPCAVFKVRLKALLRISESSLIHSIRCPILQNDTEIIIIPQPNPCRTACAILFGRSRSGLPVVPASPSVRSPSHLCSSFTTVRPWAMIYSRRPFLPRKEVIQPHLPIRLPCYDFTPVIGLTFDGCLLAVSSPASGAPNSHGVTGGVYKARERIHRGMLIRDY